MHTHYSDTDREEVVMTVENEDSAVSVQRSEKQPSVAPGRPLTFQEALDASMTKFDVALHRLAK